MRSKTPFMFIALKCLMSSIGAGLIVTIILCLIIMLLSTFAKSATLDDTHSNHPAETGNGMWFVEQDSYIPAKAIPAKILLASQPLVTADPWY